MLLGERVYRVLGKRSREVVGSVIYSCAKCKFLFERKNEPSKCPSCENQCVVGANNDERQEYKRLHGNQEDSDGHFDVEFMET